MWKFSRGDDLERRLRSAAPEAPRDLVAQIVASLDVPATARRSRRGLSAALVTAVMVVGIGAVGGFASANSFVSRITHHSSVDFGQALQAPKTIARSAANDQYGGVTLSSETVSQTISSTATTPVSIATEVPGTNQAVVVTVNPSTFTAPVTMHVDPTPPASSSAPLIGSTDGPNQLVSIVATDASGNVIHTLGAPMEIVFNKPASGTFTPVISTDGVTFKAVQLLDGTTLAADQTDGYFVDAAGKIHILTRHLTVFAVVYKANVSVSESGRKTPQAGSGLFGDPTRNHAGAPKVAKVDDTPVTVTDKGAKGTNVKLRFSVDEQSDLRLTIYDSAGNPVYVSLKGSTIRGHALSGGWTKGVHRAILRPGQMGAVLHVPSGLLKPGQTYKVQIKATDFDGHTTTTFVTFKA
jgi:hypothetical protein